MSAARLQRSLPAFLALVGLFAGTSIAQARLSDSGKKPWVVIKGSLDDLTGKKDTIVADFNSEKEARQQADQLNKALKGDDVARWLFTYRKRGKGLLKRLKEAKAAVDRARKTAKGTKRNLKAKERKLGDTIKEYKDMVSKS